MKLAHLTISNFLGARDVSLPLAPVTIIAGRNGSGKSSIRDAIALALTADLGRVSLKKDAPALISDGAKVATCTVATSDGEAYSVSIAATGKIADSQKGAEVDARLPYVLDGQRFAKLTDTERRSFLFGLMGVSSEPAAIISKLKARGLDAARVDAMEQHLRAGLSTAADRAAAHARDARAEWKGIAGSAYGETKAETWKAEAPAYAPAEMDPALQALADAEVALSKAQHTFGGINAMFNTHAESMAKLPGLQQQASLVGRITEKMTRDAAGLKDAQAAFDAASAAATGAPRVGLVHDLAIGLDAMLKALSGSDEEGLFEHAPQVEAARQALARYSAEHGPVDAIGHADPAAAGKLETSRKALDLMKSAAANNARDLRACQDAAAEVARLQALDKPDGEAHRAASDDVARCTAAVTAARTSVDKLRTAQQAAAAAAGTTAKAAAAHAAAKAWDAIAKALGPDGIPAELLAQALEPMNQRLAQSAVDTGWPAVRIGPDMTISVGGRAYALRSESEKWRADAMVAEAIAQFSGLHLLILDRMDVLDIPARSELIGWIEVLSTAGEIETALLFGTLKAAPQGLPDCFAAYWIQDGACIGAEPQREAEAA